MRTNKRPSHHSSTRWEIILGILFVFSFLGVTLALTLGSAVSAPAITDRPAIDTLIPPHVPMQGALRAS